MKNQKYIILNHNATYELLDGKEITIIFQEDTVNKPIKFQLDKEIIDKKYFEKFYLAQSSEYIVSYVNSYYKLGEINNYIIATGDSTLFTANLNM